MSLRRHPFSFFTYDTFKRLNKKTITVGSNTIVKNYTYNKTWPSVTSHTMNNIRTHYYSWNHDNRMRVSNETDTDAGYSNSYLYDNYGQLTRENNGHYGKTILYTYDNIGNITKAQKYDYTTGTVSGTPISILDSSGNTVVKYEYDAYGNCTRLSSANNDLAQNNPIRYRSYYYDEDTGLYYLNARYYNPQWHRFISPDDTAYLDAENASGLNLYAYCYNDPVNKYDPTGHFPIAALLIGIGIGALLGGITAGVSSALDGNTGWALVGDILGGALIGGATGAAFTLGGLAGVGMIGTKAAIIGFGASTVASFGAGVGANVLQSTFIGEDIDWNEAWQDGAYTAIQSAVCFWVGASMSSGGMWKSLNTNAYSSSISLFKSVGQNGLRSFANGSLLYLEMFGKDIMIRTGVKFLYTYLWSYLRNNN